MTKCIIGKLQQDDRTVKKKKGSIVGTWEASRTRLNEKSVVGSLGTRYTAPDVIFMQAFKPKPFTVLLKWGVGRRRFD